MSLHVVEQFEPVDVEQEQVERAPIARRSGKFALERQIKAVAIGKSRQTILHGEYGQPVDDPLQRLFRRYPARDVVEENDGSHVFDTARSRLDPPSVAEAENPFALLADQRAAFTQPVVEVFAGQERLFPSLDGGAQDMGELRARNP